MSRFASVERSISRQRKAIHDARSALQLDDRLRLPPWLQQRAQLHESPGRPRSGWRLQPGSRPPARHLASGPCRCRSGSAFNPRSSHRRACQVRPPPLGFGGRGIPVRRAAQRRAGWPHRFASPDRSPIGHVGPGRGQAPPSIPGSGPHRLAALPIRRRARTPGDFDTRFTVHSRPVRGCWGRRIGRF